MNKAGSNSSMICSPIQINSRSPNGEEGQLSLLVQAVSDPLCAVLRNLTQAMAAAAVST